MDGAANTIPAVAGFGIKPLESLRVHRRAAALAFVAVLAAGIPLAWIKGTPRYLATATLQVAPRYMKNVKDDNELDFQSNSQYRQFVEHQVRSVTRYDIVASALASQGAGAPPRRRVEQLQERLMVTAVPDTYLMQVALEDRTPGRLAETVNAVVEAYLARMQNEQMYGADQRLANIAAREKDVLRQIADKTARRGALALELGVATFAREGGNPYDKLLLTTRAALAEAKNARIAATARRDAFLTHGETDLTNRSIAENLLGDPGLNSLKASLNARRAVLLTQASGLTAQHPAREEIQAELTEIERAIALQSAALVADVRKSLTARYAMTVQQARSYEEGLEQVMNEQLASSARYARLFNEAATLNDEIVQAGKEIDTLRERQNFFISERSALGFVRMVTPALPPLVPYGQGRKKLMLMALGAAVLGALLAPVLIDMRERRVRDVNGAERSAGFAATGWVLERDGATTLFADEQVRRLAAALVREQAHHGARTFVLTAVKPGAGTSTLVLALAGALDALGYRSIAVEANAYRPDPRYQGRADGLAQCLQGQAAPADCIAPADAGLPERMAVGTVQPHLDRLQQLDHTIAAMPSHYKFILLDVAPLLMAADAEVIVGQLGHALLVAEADGISRGELTRAARLLTSCAPTAAGMIVNRVRLRQGGYLGRTVIEFLSRRKYAQFQTEPAWRRGALDLRARLRAAQRRLAFAFFSRSHR